MDLICLIYDRQASACHPVILWLLSCLQLTRAFITKISIHDVSIWKVDWDISPPPPGGGTGPGGGDGPPPPPPPDGSIPDAFPDVLDAPAGGRNNNSSKAGNGSKSRGRVFHSGGTSSLLETACLSIAGSIQSKSPSTDADIIFLSDVEIVSINGVVLVLLVARRGELGSEFLLVLLPLAIHLFG